MTEDLGQIAQAVRETLLQGVLSGEDPAALENSTPLITSGVLDSVRTVQLVGELEQRFRVGFEAFEISVDYLNTIDDIAETIRGKTSTEGSS